MAADQVPEARNRLARIERRRAEIERSWLRLIGYWRGGTSSMAPYWIRKLERSRQHWNKACALVASGQWPEEMIL